MHDRWRQRYNELRPHSAIGWMTPSQAAVKASSQGLVWSSPKAAQVDNKEVDRASGPHPERLAEGPALRQTVKAALTLGADGAGLDSQPSGSAQGDRRSGCWPVLEDLGQPSSIG